MKLSRIIPLFSALCLLGACASAPPRLTHATSPAPTPGSAKRVVAIAQELLGTPYRYGGTTPKGFDCSGFVQYVYRQAGVTLPRTTSAQFRAVHPVAPEELRPGDLLFFHISPEKVSHVGIYVASGQFIHAPSTGKGIGYASLGDPYWSSRLLGAGRVP